MKEKDQFLLPNAIQDFYVLLEKHPDVPKSLSYFTQFLRQFLRIPTGEQALPTIEIMTVMKHRKPVVFSIMRKQTNNVLFNILTQVEMDLETAEQKLHELIK